jgi:hypothetical protein
MKIDPIIIENVKKIISKEGYNFKELQQSDWGLSLEIIVEKDGKEFIFPIVKQYYDTDKDCNVIKYHGEINVTESKWYKDNI